MKNIWLNQLSLWHNDFDYVIAHDPKHAIELMEDSGFWYEGIEEFDWYALDPASMFIYKTENGDIEQTVQEFIDQIGPGYFGNTDY